MNNAALERLASVTDRVQARPVPSALEKRQPKSVSLEGYHSSDAAKSGRHAEGAEKRWNMKNAGTGGEAGGRSH
ncbi:DNA polymerase III subunit tau [Escherichia coli]|nr:DNA polymerase III subunit tau [Escherichia coli]